MGFNDYIKKVRNYLPTMGGPGKVPPTNTPPAVDVPPEKGDPTKNLRKYVSPVQLARIVTDVKSLNESITEAENAWYPQRIRLQQQFLTTIRNGHVSACMDRRINLTKLKDFRLVDEAGEEDEVATKVLKSAWFRSLMHFSLEAKAFGYSLITLGNLEDSKFPNLSIIRRFNISPDRLNVTQYIYSISGAKFMEPPYVDWHIWVPTPTDVGVSLCGYGYLYKVALYEIFCRNTLSQNSTAAELYGMPIRVGSTAKTEEAERAEYENALANMGAAGYILKDLSDELELVESKAMGTGYKIYESLETRCEKKISKIILGHADALDSTPGKLGSGQDGEDSSPVGAALRDTATNDMTDFVFLMNDVILPKLINLGFSEFIGRTFEFSNNDELVEQRVKEDTANQVTAEIYQLIKQAGGDPDWKYFTDRTGIPVEPTPPPAPTVIHQAPAIAKSGEKPLEDKVKNKLARLYGR